MLSVEPLQPLMLVSNQKFPPPSLPTTDHLDRPLSDPLIQRRQVANFLVPLRFGRFDTPHSHPPDTLDLPQCRSTSLHHDCRRSCHSFHQQAISRCHRDSGWPTGRWCLDRQAQLYGLRCHRCCHSCRHQVQALAYVEISSDLPQTPNYLLIFQILEPKKVLKPDAFQEFELTEKTVLSHNTAM